MQRLHLRIVVCFVLAELTIGNCFAATNIFMWTKLDSTVPSDSNSNSTNGRIPLGSSGKGDSIVAKFPCVIKDGDVYKMWYCGGDASGSRILYATSPDGLNWAKYNNAAPSESNGSSTDGRIPQGGSGRADANAVYRACVIEDDGTYKMWYDGGNGGTSYVLYATSPDCLTWTKSNNVIPEVSDASSTDGRVPPGTAGKGDDGGAGSPWVIKDGATYKMWYTGKHEGTNRIYHATSPDGLVWTKYNNDTPPNSSTTSTDGRIPRSATSGTHDQGGVSEPTVFKDPHTGTYMMWYAGLTGASGNYRIFLATSANGLDWVKCNDIAATASDTTSTDGRIALGTTSDRGDAIHTSGLGVLKTGHTYRTWYTGYGGTTGRYRIYYASFVDAPAGTVFSFK